MGPTARASSFVPGPGGEGQTGPLPGLTVTVFLSVFPANWTTPSNKQIKHRVWGVQGNLGYLRHLFFSSRKACNNFLIAHLFPHFYLGAKKI